MASEPRKAKNDHEKAVEHYFELARTAMAAPGFAYTLDVTPLMRIGESVTNELALAEKHDGTPALLVVDDFAPARWIGVFDALLKHTYDVVGTAAVAPKPEEAPASPLGPALDALEEERRRLSTAIGGNSANRERERALRQAIYGGRTPHRGRASYESEFETIIASIKAMKDAPTAVKKMLPRLETALRTLQSLPPTPAGRPVRETEGVPVPVQHAALALNFALSDLLAQAGVDATDARLASLQRVIVGRRKGDAEGAEEKGPVEAVAPLLA